MTDHVLAHVDGIKSSLDLYIEQTNIPAMTIDKIRLTILKEFEENDKRRGVPYLAHTPKVSDTVRIEYKEKVEFGQDEEPFVVGIYSDSFLNGPIKTVQPTGVVEEEPFTDQDEYNSLVESGSVDGEDEDKWSQKPNTYVDVLASDEESSYESEDSGELDDSDEEFDESDDQPSHEVSAATFLSSLGVSAPEVFKETTPSVVPEVVAEKKIAAPIVVPKVVRPKKIIKVEAPAPVATKVVPTKSSVKSTSDIFDEFDTMFSVVSNPVEKPAHVRQEIRNLAQTRRLAEVTEAKTVRELVKNNPGCTIEFAKQFFPEREIKKQISVGRIYYKNGKLTI